MAKIIVDMMGGDHAPAEMVKGVAMACAELESTVEYILVGDKGKIETAARENGVELVGCEIVHTETAITMEDDPILVVRGKDDSSMSVGLRMLKEGKGDAFVSAGNTGALFTGASLIVRKLKGVRRPAIAALMPLQNPVLLADSGANITVTPEYLEHFAIMGSAYMKNVMGVENPRVGLLNNGAEEHKGTELQIETYKRLSSSSAINFVGNIEGNTVMQNTCDVIVADGFTGNIFLKTAEGLGKMMLKSLKGVFYKNIKTKLAALLIKNDIGDMRKKFDSSEIGGAPILGIAKPVIKAHGSSKEKKFKSALRQAIFCAQVGITEDISRDMQELGAIKKAQKAASQSQDKDS